MGTAMAEREGAIEAANPEVWVYFGCKQVLGDELLILRSSLLTHSVFSMPRQQVRPGREGSRTGRTKPAKIHPLPGPGLQTLRSSGRAAVALRPVQAGSLGSRGDGWLITRPRGHLSSMRASSVLQASKQGAACRAAAPSAGLLGDCSPCEPPLPRQRCCLGWGRESGLKVGKMTKTLQLCIAFNCLEDIQAVASG